MTLRALPVALLAGLFLFAGCDAVTPSAAADAAPHPYQVVGPSFVQVGDCDTFVIKDQNGTPQSGYNWAVAQGGSLVASSTASAFVLAESTSKYTVSANVNSPSGPVASKTVWVSSNPNNTYEC